jgi:hypothetical protein
MAWRAVLTPYFLRCCCNNPRFIASLQAKVSDIEPQVLAKGYTGDQYKACITYAMPLQCSASATIACALLGICLLPSFCISKSATTFPQ